MPLTIALRDDAPPIEFSGATPDGCAGLTLAEIERIPLAAGNRLTPLGELAAVSGGPSDRDWRITGDARRVHGLGEGMTAGRIFVEGNVGPRAGASLRGGEIEIAGDADLYLGAEMRGGSIRVRGSAGDSVGAAYPGGKRGMNGGTIYIHGSAGDDLGAMMRRGLIAVAGDCGAFAGTNLIAGTILVAGRVGGHPGAAMRRGTLVLCQSTADDLGPAFRAACRYRPTFLLVYLRALAAAGFPLPPNTLEQEWVRSSGDLCELGKGEILTPA